AAGGTFNWIITAVVANGPTTSATHITDTAPAGMTFGAISKGASGGGTVASLTCTAASGSPIDCTIASGASSGTYTITVAVTAPAANNTANCHSYTNTATSQYGTQTAVQTTDAVTVTGCLNPSIGLLKTDNTSHSVAAGGSFNWIITATVA